MTNIFTVNAGSSSVRLTLLAGPDAGKITRVASERYEKSDTNLPALLDHFVNQHRTEPPDVIVHRVVHGGMRFTESCRIDDEVEGEIERLASFAPLHNPAALAWMHATRGKYGSEIPQVAVFDTAFYTTLPPVSKSYAIDAKMAQRNGLVRYGFHGLAHLAMWRRWCALAPQVKAGGRVISLQLGAGCSATAISQGEPKDTSMGFSPLEGLVMATRSGDLDPGVVTYLQRAEKIGPSDLDRILNEQSGLLGVSGESGDMRALLVSKSPAASLAVDLFCYRARKYLGAYLAVLGGADAVLFGGGIGENAPVIRERILAGMEWSGLSLDTAANEARGIETCISSPGGRVAVWVIPVDEAQVMAQEAMAVMDKKEAL